MIVPNNPREMHWQYPDFTNDGPAAHVGFLCCDEFPATYHSDLSVEQELW
jgi:hypothetical protein